MKNKMLAAIPLLIAIALSIFGFVYAHWSDPVQIEGTVRMGSLTLAFGNKPPIEPPKCREFYVDPITGELVEGEWLGKNVGECSAHYQDRIEDVHTGKYGYKILNITVVNAYPQYRVHTTFRVHNIGTIPLNICNYTITGEKRNATGVVYDLLWHDPDGDWIGELWEDVNGNGVVDTAGPDKLVINLEITNAIPYQIDPCKDNKAQIDLDFKQDAQECHIYTIHVTIPAIQWNKPCP